MFLASILQNPRKQTQEVNFTGYRKRIWLPSSFHSDSKSTSPTRIRNVLKLELWTQNPILELTSLILFY